MKNIKIVSGVLFLLFLGLVFYGCGRTVGGGAGSVASVMTLLYEKEGEVANNCFGISVSGAGDVNHDGYADVIVGAYQADAGSKSMAGKAYIYSGQNGSLLCSFEGEASYDYFGCSVSGAGDVNHDGYADVIIGAYKADPGSKSSAGKAYIYSGQNGSLLCSFEGEAASDYFGWSVAGAGDVNHDGYADIIIGAYRADPSGKSSAGKAYVYSGQDGSLLYSFDGEAASDYFGYSVCGAGDVNNDGYADLIIGAYKADPSGKSSAGKAYIYSGQDGSLLYSFDGEVASDYFGYSVCGAGDVNNDGYADLIIGAYGADPNSLSSAGKAYVYSGQNGNLLCSFEGEAAGDVFGYSVSGAGDVNNDGYADVIVGAYTATSSSESSVGKAYLYSGQNCNLLCSFEGEATNDFFGWSVCGAGDVDNNNYADIIVGATQNGNGGNGKAYVYGYR